MKKIALIVVIIILVSIISGGTVYFFTIKNINKGNISNNDVNTNQSATLENDSKTEEIRTTENNETKKSTSQNSYQQNKKTKKVYNVVVINGAKLTSFDSSTGYVSYKRYCNYCGNEWGSNSFYIQKTEDITYSCGYCIKCNKYIGDCKFSCTVTEILE